MGNSVAQAGRTKKQVNPAPKLAISTAEFGELFSVSKDSVNRRIREGEIKAIKFGRRVLIPRSEVERLLQVS